MNKAIKQFETDRKVLIEEKLKRLKIDTFDKSLYKEALERVHSMAYHLENMIASTEKSTLISGPNIISVLDEYPISIQKPLSSVILMYLEEKNMGGLAAHFKINPLLQMEKSALLYYHKAEIILPRNFHAMKEPFLVVGPPIIQNTDHEIVSFGGEEYVRVQMRVFTPSRYPNPEFTGDLEFYTKKEIVDLINKENEKNLSVSFDNVLASPSKDVLRYFDEDTTLCFTLSPDISNINNIANRSVVIFDSEYGMLHASINPEWIEYYEANFKEKEDG